MSPCLPASSVCEKSLRNTHTWTHPHLHKLVKFQETKWPREHVQITELQSCSLMKQNATVLGVINLGFCKIVFHERFPDDLEKCIKCINKLVKEEKSKIK